MAERLGNWAINQKVRFPAVQNDVVSLGKTLHPTGECPCTCCKSFWVRVSAKCKREVGLKSRDRVWMVVGKEVDIPDPFCVFSTSASELSLQHAAISNHSRTASQPASQLANPFMCSQRMKRVLRVMAPIAFMPVCMFVCLTVSIVASMSNCQTVSSSQLCLKSMYTAQG